MVSGGRKDSEDRNFWGCRNLPLVSIPAAHWGTDPLDLLGNLLQVVDVFLNPGIAGIGTDMPEPFGEEAVGKTEVLYRR